jgi:hypothetical protein
MKDAFDVMGFVGMLSLILVPIAAWLTHVIYCLSAAKYVLLLAGGIVAPIGVIHGVGIWFGAGW